MIRQANKFDKPAIIEMMLEFCAESGIEQYQGVDNQPYWNRLLDAMFAGAGVIFYDEGKGLLMALVTPTIWCDKTFQMQEIAWYVRPEWRKTTVGYRLFDAYVKHGKQLKEEGRIKMFSISKLPTTPDLKYDKFGFRKLDENWMQ